MDLVLLLIALLIVQALLMGRKKTDNPVPGSLGDMNVATAEAGRVVPVFWGTCNLQSPNVVWYGDFGTTEIHKNQDDVVSSSCCGCCGSANGYVVVGYRYYIGMDMILACGKVDELLGIFIGDKLFWQGSRKPGSNGYQYVFLENLNFMGGDDSSGGISAKLDFYFGTDDQPVNPYLKRQVGCETNYGGVAHVVMRGKSENSGYIGTSTYASPWKFVMRRLPRVLAGMINGNTDITSNACIANINGDANPAEIIFECYTNTFWGLGMSYDDVNLDMFKAAAVTLKNEDLGMSTVVDSLSAVVDVIDDIKRYINATVYIDPSDGRLCLKLIRDDYEVSTLPVLDPSNVMDIKLSRQGWYETINELKLTFTERMISPTQWEVDHGDDYDVYGTKPQYAFKTRTVIVNDLANYFVQDEIINSNTVDCPALSNEHVAINVAYRLLANSSQGFAKADLTVNRASHTYYPGAPFVLNWDPYGFKQRVFRVVDIEYGELVDSEVKITAIEDIFSLAKSAHGNAVIPLSPSGDPITNGTTSWIPQVHKAAPIAKCRLEEVPYMSWGYQRVIMASIARPNQYTDKYKISAKMNENDQYVFTYQNTKFFPFATLLGAYPANTDAIDEIGFVIQSVVDCDGLVSITAAQLLAAGRNGAMLGDEMVAWRDVTDMGAGKYRICGVVRGIADTVPADHPNGIDVWIISLNPGVNSDNLALGPTLVQNPAIFGVVTTSIAVPPGGPMTADGTMYVRITPGSSNGFISNELGYQDHLTTRSRAWRPYAPGKIRINNQAWPTNIVVDAVHGFNVTWAYRKKLSQLTRTQDDDSDTNMDPNVGYNIELYCNDVLISTYADIINDHQYVTSDALFAAIGVGNIGIVRLEIYARTLAGNILESWQRQVRTFAVYVAPSDYSDINCSVAIVENTKCNEIDSTVTVL